VLLGVCIDELVIPVMQNLMYVCWLCKILCIFVGYAKSCIIFWLCKILCIFTGLYKIVVCPYDSWFNYVLVMFNWSFFTWYDPHLQHS
jgi:hypothetical protein